MLMVILKDENVIVLDFLPRGHATGRQEPIAQVLGEKYFSLLEIVVRKDKEIKPGEKIYIGEGKRDHVDHIKRRLTIKDLTSFAKSELESVIENLVKNNENRFVDFFNKAQPISTRLHQLELLPGVGKKHMWDIIEEREKGPFKSFEDVKKRIKLMPDPFNSIVKRIMEELQNNTVRYRIFVSGPTRRF